MCSSVACQLLGIGIDDAASVVEDEVVGGIVVALLLVFAPLPGCLGLVSLVAKAAKACNPPPLTMGGTIGLEASSSNSCRAVSKFSSTTVALAPVRHRRRRTLRKE